MVYYSLSDHKKKIPTHVGIFLLVGVCQSVKSMTGATWLFDDFCDYAGADGAAAFADG